MSIIKLSNVSKFYYNKKTISSGFNKINVEFDMGEFVVITGESGSGKSTLLNVISGLDSYEEGEMYINGEETSHYTEVDYENYRRKYIGNIFQNFNLVNSYTVYENIELVLLLNGYKRREIKDKILDIIKTVGLTKYKNTKASKLSGGQKQRVAIARALAKDTPIIVADEPTGSLDVKSARSIMKLLHDISKEKLVVIVTHNYEQVEEYATRKISMHDGKIIEDKKIVKTEPVKANPVQYKNISNKDKILLGFKNAFNIKTKFLLLLMVYFFLTLLVFSEYTSLQKIDYDNDSSGYNYFFQDVSSNRVIVNKKDRSAFTRDDIDNIGKLENVDHVVENDILLDIQVSVYDNGNYIHGSVSSLNGLKDVDVGTLPSSDHEIVVSASQNSSYLLFSEEDDLIGKEFYLQNDSSSFPFDYKVKIVGIKYDDSLMYNAKIYTNDTILNDLMKIENLYYSSTELEVNNQIFKGDKSRLYYDIVPSALVASGKAVVFQDLNLYCKDYSCTGKEITLNVNNIYYEDSATLKVSKIYNKDNFKELTGYDDVNDFYNVIFISMEYYDKLYSKGTYQISAYLKDAKNANNTIKKLNDLSYQTFYVKNALADPVSGIMGIIRLIRSIVFIIATIILFFISYFVIKIILKSRNIYFSTIRILGATKKISKQLLNIELLIDINVAYILFLLLVLAVKINLIDITYISDMVSFLKIYDYVVVYLILMMMSLLISNRYSHKLFKDSVMHAYREDV